MPATISLIGEGTDSATSPRSVVMTTRSVPAHESLDYWHDAVFASLVGMDIQTESGTYDATMRTGPAGDLQITTVDCDPGVVRRTPEFIARDGGESVLIGLQSTGVARVEQDGRTTELRAGELAFFETIRPFTTSYPEPFQMKVFSVPRTLLGQSEADLSRLTATPLRPTDRLGAVVSPFLARLADVWEGCGEAMAEGLARNAVDLLTAVATDRLGGRVDQLPGADRVMLLRVQRWIRWHLSDPELTPAAAARAHGISLRYLHRLFEGESLTLCQWVRELRLQECRKALAAAPSEDVSVARIARRWGFTSGAQLSRAFRGSYGLSPTDWLRQERERRSIAAPSFPEPSFTAPSFPAPSFTASLTAPSFTAASFPQEAEIRTS